MMGLLDRRDRVADDWTESPLAQGQPKPYLRRPSDYWRSNCYAGISPFDPSQVADGDLGTTDDGDAGFHISSDNAMFGVDYPHPETIFPRVMDQARRLADMPNVSDADARKVLYQNAADVYHLDLDRLQPHFDRVGFELDEAVAAPA
jgi:hypothetical protein